MCLPRMRCEGRKYVLFMWMPPLNHKEMVSELACCEQLLICVSKNIGMAQIGVYNVVVGRTDVAMSGCKPFPEGFANIPKRSNNTHS